MVSRRNFLQSSTAMSALAALPLSVRWSVAQAEGLIAGLSDPAMQPKFINMVPDALAPSFIYQPNKKGVYNVDMAQTSQYTGLVNPRGKRVATTVWGYGTDDGVSWPGPTFQVQKDVPTQVKWSNSLTKRNGQPLPHLLPVDETAHWCYSLDGYKQFSIKKNGVPLIPHLHGGHSDFQYDGNPEFFMSPDREIVGPQWTKNGLTGVEKVFEYSNDQVAGNLWYHDHALGITRLNVYAGLAGFYFIRDDDDTGKAENSYDLPAWPYEKAYAIQDRMFRDTGELFYPAFPGEPFYNDFITGEGAILPPELFPNGGPTALAEFFGDHMVVNGVIWPKEDVEQRNYRFRLLNGTDSRFMGIRFRAVDAGATEFSDADPTVPFFVIGSDQGLSTAPVSTDSLIFEPGSRYDIVIDFKQVALGSRVILENYLGDAPFGGDLPGPDDVFGDRQTDRVMAFDVIPDSGATDNFNVDAMTTALSTTPTAWTGIATAADTTRRVALFEGTDEFGRLQPLLGTAEPTMDSAGSMVEGAIAWHMPTTENPVLGETEIWEIYNATGDAHPVHLHLVHFEILDRKEIEWDTATNDEDRVLAPGGANGDGTYMLEQPILQHNGLEGTGFRLENLTTGGVVEAGPDYIENAPKDMVTALPGQVTRIKATFDKPGRYVWHCHILSHEDHEMMRVLHVGPGA